MSPEFCFDTGKSEKYSTKIAAMGGGGGRSYEISITIERDNCATKALTSIPKIHSTHFEDCKTIRLTRQSKYPDYML
jgi:hypothetical protein